MYTSFIPIIATFTLQACSVFAYRVVSPSEASSWNTTGPNILAWERVATDPDNFTAVLVNEVSVTAN